MQDIPSSVLILELVIYKVLLSYGTRPEERSQVNYGDW